MQSIANALMLVNITDLQELLKAAGEDAEEACVPGGAVNCT